MQTRAVAYGVAAFFISGLSSFGLGVGLRGDVSAAAAAEPSADRVLEPLPSALDVIELAAFCLDS